MATALQMISWGVKVNDYGNAELDDQGRLIKVEGQGIEEPLWAEMLQHAAEKGWKGGNIKKLCLPFDNKIMSQPKEIRERMADAVESFVFNLLTEVFGAQDTAPLGIQAILEAGSHDLGPKGTRTEDPANWTEQKIRERAKTLNTNKGPAGDFDD